MYKKMYKNMTLWYEYIDSCEQQINEGWWKVLVDLESKECGVLVSLYATLVVSQKHHRAYATLKHRSPQQANGQLRPLGFFDILIFNILVLKKENSSISNLKPKPELLR